MAQLGKNITLTANSVAVAEIKNTSMPEVSVNDVEYSYLDQTEDHKLFLPGLHDTGVLGCEAYFSPASFSAINSLIGVEDTPFVITTGTVTYSWDGYVNKCGGATFEREGFAMFKFEVRTQTDITIGTTS